MKRRLLQVGAALLVLCVAAFSGLQVLGHVLTKKREEQCRDNLRRIALAAIEYSDSRQGLYPHVGAAKELDGDVDSGDSLRAFHTLIWSGYLQDPEALVCPMSVDIAYPRADEVGVAPRRWDWEGEVYATPNTSPLVAEEGPKRTLRGTSELSYGWTRRQLSGNTRGDAFLAADRAVIEAHES